MSKKYIVSGVLEVRVPFMLTIEVDGDAEAAGNRARYELSKGAWKEQITPGSEWSMTWEALGNAVCDVQEVPWTTQTS